MKSLPVLAAFIALVVSMCWLLGSLRTKESPSQTPKILESQPPQTSTATSNSTAHAAASPKQLVIGQTELAVTLANANAANAKLDKTLASRTEQQQRQMVERFMIGRQPHYDTLFESWGLSKSERQAVLDMIQSRELQLRSEMVNAAKQNTNPAARLQRTANLKEAAALGLEALLGPDLAQQLSALERILEEDSLKQFRRRVAASKE